MSSVSVPPAEISSVTSSSTENNAVQDVPKGTSQRSDAADDNVNNADGATNEDDDDDEISSDDDENECVRAQGQICVCQSCERERLKRMRKLEKKKARKLSALKRRRAEQQQVNDMDLVPDSDGSFDGKGKKRSKSSNQSLPPSSVTSPSSSSAELCQLVDSPGSMPPEIKIAKMTSACRTILECIGEDPDREGLRKTPQRWAKALLFMTNGYAKSIPQVVNNAIFAEDDHKEMVVVKDIDIHSMCEHHMVPFTGVVHVGYIPNGKIIGLSKIARIAEVFARRLQVQERLTRQIANAMLEEVQPLGVGVVVECSHFCMVMRGVQKVGARTVTSCVRGCFESNPKTRAEFLNIIKGGAKSC